MSKVRIISIYATKWLHRECGTQETEPSLELGRLRDFYNYFQDQLPRPLLHELMDPERVTFGTAVAAGTAVASGAAVAAGTAVASGAAVGAGTDEGGGGAVPRLDLALADCWLFGLPADQVVAAFTFDLYSPPLTSDTVGICAALENCMNADIAIDGVGLAQYVERLAERVKVETVEHETVQLLPERHQLVFAEELANYPFPTEAVIKEILFREDPPYREEFTQMRRPEELNQQDRTLGALTPYVSFLYGHKQFVQDSIFLSTVQAVGTASRFRQIWREAHRRVQEFRRDHQRQAVGVQQRRDLEALVDRLGNLEFDLTFSVEFPLMRIESFHSALYQAMDLPAQADTLSRMFTQLAGSIGSEITAIDIRERRWEEYKQRWNAVAASVLSIIGVPIGFLVAFFGINAKQVRAEWSMFDHHYLVPYLVAIAIALIPVCLITYPRVRKPWLMRAVVDTESATARTDGRAASAAVSGAPRAAVPGQGRRALTADAPAAGPDAPAERS